MDTLLWKHTACSCGGYFRSLYEPRLFWLWVPCPETLSVRTYICPHCGLIMDRDHNSAVSIRDEGLRTWGHRETDQGRALVNASGQTTTTRRGKLRPRKSAG